MTERIISQAQEWGFVCKCDLQGNLQIVPRDKTDRWKLHFVEDKWLLLVGDVPQISLHPSEAMVFLERRWTGSKNLDATEPSV